MTNWPRHTIATIDRLRTAAETWLGPLVLLAVRLWLAKVFFNAGLVKISDWDATQYLFATEYLVPVLPPAAAALLATVWELGMPPLLAAGLFTRVAALPLLATTAIIQFVLGASNPVYNNAEHIYWLLLLSVLVVRGPGVLSLDYLG